MQELPKIIVGKIKDWYQGGIIEKEAPVHASNVMLVQDNQPTRTGKRILADGSRVRYGKKTGEQVDEGK